MRSWERTDKPIVLAHRGGADEYPENSVQAFEGMRAQGFNYIETDAQATSDGVLILIHDPLLDRTTNGSGEISQVSWAEVSQLRDESGHAPMTVKAALDGFPDIDFNIDAKVDGTVEPMIELLRGSDYLDQVLVAAFSEKRLRRIRTAVPGVATSLGTSGVARLVLASILPSFLSDLVMKAVPGPSDGAACVQMPMNFRGVRILSKKLIDIAHGHGLAVHIWTINEVKDMIEILDMGADGIITDRPSLARELIENRDKQAQEP